MSKAIRVLSVPHSGTRFLLYEVLRPAGYYVMPQQDNGHGAIHAHFGVLDPNIGGKPPAFSRDDLPTIIPLREKGSVIESWRRRKKPLDELEAAWGELEDFLATHDPYLLRIEDRGSRQSDLQAIADLLGVERIKVNWNKKVGHR